MKNKCKIFKKGNKQSGITLVALVVTIVVLLILAGVSLSLVLDNNGIITRAGDAKEEYGKARENEQKDLNSIEEWMDNATGGSGSETVVKVNAGEKATGVATINGKTGNTNNPTIPKGYIPVNTETANWGDGSSAPAQTAVDHGLVIQDESGNQWVWVPVEDMSEYYESVDAGVTISGSTVTTKKYTKLSIEIGTGDNKKTITRGVPGSTSYREPDLVVGSDGTSYDAANYKTIVGNNGTLKEMAKLFKDEYETMIKSIEKYGGFYIGRYELSGTVDNPTEKSGATITNQSWYNLYNACKKLGANSDGSDKEGIATRMIWGCQWDATCDFIATKGEGKNIKDSSTWGNYTNYNTANNYTEGTTGYVKDAGTKLDTGTSEYWKANNIYDIAGNCYEWTQEAIGASNRAYRGGSYGYRGSSDPASVRFNDDPTYSYYDFARFPSHFNNYYWNLERENQWKEEQNRLTENRTKRRRKPLIANESTNSVIRKL